MFDPVSACEQIFYRRWAPPKQVNHYHNKKYTTHGDKSAKAQDTLRFGKEIPQKVRNQLGMHRQHLKSGRKNPEKSVRSTQNSFRNH